MQPDRGSTHTVPARGASAGVAVAAAHRAAAPQVRDVYLSSREDGVVEFLAEPELEEGRFTKAPPRPSAPPARLAKKKGEKMIIEKKPWSAPPPLAGDQTQGAFAVQRQLGARAPFRRRGRRGGSGLHHLSHAPARRALRLRARGALQHLPQAISRAPGPPVASAPLPRARP